MHAHSKIFEIKYQTLEIIFAFDLTWVLVGLNGGKAINFLQLVGIWAAYMCALCHVYLPLHLFASFHSSRWQSAKSAVGTATYTCAEKRGCTRTTLWCLRTLHSHNYLLSGNLSFTFNEFELYCCRYHFTRFPCSSRSILSLMCILCAAERLSMRFAIHEYSGRALKYARRRRRRRWRRRHNRR